MLRAADLRNASDATRRAAIADALALAQTDEARAVVAAVVREAGLDPHALFPDIFALDGKHDAPAPTAVAFKQRDASKSALGAARFSSKVLSSAALALAQSDPKARNFDPAKRSEPYDVRVELPNFFGPIGVGARGEINARKELLSAALGNVLRRVEIPVPDGKGGFTQARFFDRLPPELRNPKDGGPRVLASGGVIRAALAFLYREMLAGMQREPQTAPEATLLALAQSEANVPAHLIRGVNSDWDMLIDCKPEEAPTWKAAVTRAAQGAFDEAGGHAKLQLGAHFERSLFLVADVKEYGPQLALTAAQGGSDLDWLAFDVARGTFVEPKESPGVLDRLIGEGTFKFHAPRDVSQMKDPADTALRAMRPFLELPFLKIADPAPLMEALSSIERSGNKASERAVGQIAKAMANGVEGGAHNRLTRDDDEVIKKLLSVAEKVASGSVKRFVDTWPTGDRVLGTLPRDLLMPVNEFVDKFTVEGAVFHGTPSLESALAMARGGMFVSDADQGRALYGRGGYTTKDLDVARQYAGREGVVFRLPLALDKNLNVLHWPSVEKHPFMKDLVQRAGSLDAAFEILAKDHGIDVIVNTHVIVQNAAALKFPSSPAELVEGYASVLENPETTPGTLVAALAVYQSLYAYASALGKKLKPPADYLPRLHELAVTRPREEIGDDLTSHVRPLASLALEAYTNIYSQLRVFEPARAHKTATPLAVLADVVKAHAESPQIHAYGDMRAMRDYIGAFIATPKEERGTAPSPLTMADHAVHLSLTGDTSETPLMMLLRLQKSGVLKGAPTSVALVEKLVAAVAKLKRPGDGLAIVDAALFALGNERKRVSLAPLAAPLLAKGLASQEDLESHVRRYLEIWKQASPSERSTIPHPETALAAIAKHAEAGAKYWYSRPARVYALVYEAAGKPKNAASPDDVAWAQLAVGTTFSDEEVTEIQALARTGSKPASSGPFKARLDAARARIDKGDADEVDSYAAILRALSNKDDARSLCPRALTELEKHVDTLAKGSSQWSPWPHAIVDLLATTGNAGELSQLRKIMERAAKIDSNDERVATLLANLSKVGIAVDGVDTKKRDVLVEKAIVHGSDTHDWLVRQTYQERGREAIKDRLLDSPPPDPRGVKALLTALPSTERAQWAEELASLVDQGGWVGAMSAVALLSIARPSPEMKAKAEDAIAAALITDRAIIERSVELLVPTLWSLAQKHHPLEVARAASEILATARLPYFSRDDAFHGPSLEHLVKAALGQLPAPASGAAARLQDEGGEIVFERVETVGAILAALGTSPLALELLERSKVPVELQATYAHLLDDPRLRVAFARACAASSRVSSPVLRAKAHALLEGSDGDLKKALETIARRQ